MKIAVIGAFDTKGAENAYLVSEIRRLGADCCTIDISTRGEPGLIPDYSAADVAAEAGSSIDILHDLTDRPAGMAIMSRGAARIVDQLRRSGQIQGVVAMGGGQGTNMAIPVMRALPIGFPKLLFSTIAGLPAAVKDFEGINDTVLVNSLVDVAGLNDILRMGITRSAGAIVGMASSGAEALLEPSGRKKRVGITMWGVTTKAVDAVRSRLEDAGVEVYAFHASGLGGPVMEKMIDQGFFDGIVDLTLAEVSNPLVGGNYDRDETRMRTAGKRGLPMVVIPGGVDMISAHPPLEKLPSRFQRRQRYFHNADLVFIRTSPEENRLIGQEIASRINESRGIVKVLLPMRGFSAVDAEGGPLWDPASDEALADSLRTHVKSGVSVQEYPLHINDPCFAALVADTMMELLNSPKK